MRDLTKRHIIKLKNMKCEGCTQTIEENLTKILGINQINANYHEGKVNVTYNLKFINYKKLEKKLRELGYYPARGLLNAIKRGFINFTEKNEAAGQELKFNSSKADHHNKKSLIN